MYALISGGTGVTGAALLRFLLNRGDRVVALIRPNSPRSTWLPKHTNLQIVSIALGEYAKESHKIPDHPDVFVHLAWDGSRGKEKVGNRNNIALQSANIQSCIDAAELCHKIKCPVFVCTGSQAEYGNLDFPAREDMCCKPTNGYGAAKLCAGQMTRILCSQYGIRHIWARLFSVYGPHDGTESLIDTSIASLLEGVSPAYTMGEQIWDYIYSYDAAYALSLLAEQGEDGEIYNVASGDPHPLSFFIQQMHTVVDPKIAPKIGAKSYSPNQIMHLEADITKLKRRTNFFCRFSFAQGIYEILQQYISNKKVASWSCVQRSTLVNL